MTFFIGLKENTYNFYDDGTASGVRDTGSSLTIGYKEIENDIYTSGLWYLFDETLEDKSDYGNDFVSSGTTELTTSGLFIDRSLGGCAIFETEIFRSKSIRKCLTCSGEILFIIEGEWLVKTT